MARYSFIFVVGAPGSGKGTICKKLAEEFNLCHLSIGDFLRAGTRARTLADHDVIENSLNMNELLPWSLLGQLIFSKIEHEYKQTGCQRFLLDGFPRDLAQCSQFEKQYSDARELLLYLECPKEIAKQRFLARDLPDRPRQNEGTFEKRYEQFEDLNPLIVEAYEDLPDGLVKVDSSGSTKTTYKKVLDTLQTNSQWRMITHEPEVGMFEMEPEKADGEERRGPGVWLVESTSRYFGV